MTRNYSSKAFFRDMPNALLARYFKERDLFKDMDFAKMKEGNPDKLFNAWLSLPDSQRSKMDSEFRDIFEMSCDKGFQAIIDEASWHLNETPDDLRGFIERLSALSNHFERAMITFLDHNTFWKGATLFHHSDTLSYWRKRKNLPRRKAAVDKASVQQLAEMISKYFHLAEGRGKHCVVEPFRRGELDYFFAYPEDYSQQSIEWVEGEFDRRPHNPAFEIIYVYSQDEGSLDLSIRGSKKTIETLQGIFSAAILKEDRLPPDPKDERIYDLSPLLQKSFDFTYSAGSGIEEVTIKKIRLSSKVKKGDRITLEADTTKNPNAVYDLLEQIGKSIALDMYNITLVELSTSVVVDPGKPAKKVPIRITYPNSCSLKYDEIGLKLRDMLEASGIEPRLQAENSNEEKRVEA